MKKILIIVTMFFSLPIWAGNISGLRNARYCEILLNFNNFGHSLHVYNTIGLNDCPKKQWDMINPDKIKKETGAVNVYLNGPRRWIIDGMKNSTLMNSKIKEFNGIAMHEAGILELPLLFRKLKPYTQMIVQRHTTWVYQSHQPVYELIDSNGNVFIMQSYRLQKEIQTQANLAELSSLLILPKNWHFRMRILDKNYYLTPLNQKAIVLQDNLLNTYQMEVQ